MRWTVRAVICARSVERGRTARAFAALRTRGSASGEPPDRPNSLAERCDVCTERVGVDAAKPHAHARARQALQRVSRSPRTLCNNHGRRLRLRRRYRRAAVRLWMGRRVNVTLNPTRAARAFGIV